MMPAMPTGRFSTGTRPVTVRPPLTQATRAACAARQGTRTIRAAHTHRTGMQITIDWRYRDAGGWQSHGQLALVAPDDDAVRAVLLARLRATLSADAGDRDAAGFIPEDVYLGPLRGTDWVPTEDDHCWHTLELDTVTVLDDVRVVVDGDLEELVEEFETAAAAGWPGQHDESLFFA
jgi:hypothetical protein